MENAFLTNTFDAELMFRTVAVHLSCYENKFFRNNLNILNQCPHLGYLNVNFIYDCNFFYSRNVITKTQTKQIENLADFFDICSWDFRELKSFNFKGIKSDKVNPDLKCMMRR
jgi:hypothetical protein